MLLRIALLTLLLGSTVPAIADHPTAGLWLPRIEPFDWIEKLEPKNYRERYNRPRYVGGKIAYYIAPSSQEGMAWHEHKHRGSYRNHAGPVFKSYNYPKPWEALQVGPRSAYPIVAPGSGNVISDRVISETVIEDPMRSLPHGY